MSPVLLIRRLLALLALLGGWSHAAAAETLAGVTMPDVMTVQGKLLQLNGMGLRSFTMLQIHGYVAGLYVPVPAHDAATLLASTGPKLLRIQYVHAASLSRVQGEMRGARARSCGNGCPKTDEDAFALLIASARAVQPGDTATYVYGADGALQVLFNGATVATIDNPDFSRRALESMIGAQPPSAALRRGLLGG